MLYHLQIRLFTNLCCLFQRTSHNKYYVEEPPDTGNILWLDFCFFKISIFEGSSTLQNSLLHGVSSGILSSHCVARPQFSWSEFASFEPL